MASTFSKRLAKLEELLASRLNQPLATLWLDEGETREERCIKAGYESHRSTAPLRPLADQGRGYG